MTYVTVVTFAIKLCPCIRFRFSTILSYTIRLSYSSMLRIIIYSTGHVFIQLFFSYHILLRYIPIRIRLHIRFGHFFRFVLYDFKSFKLRIRFAAIFLNNTGYCWRYLVFIRTEKTFSRYIVLVTKWIKLLAQRMSHFVTIIIQRFLAQRITHLVTFIIRRFLAQRITHFVIRSFLA